MKYMLKKIIIGVSIGLLLFFIKGYIVNAKTLSYTFPDNTRYNLPLGSQNLLLNFGNMWAGNGNGAIYFSFLSPNTINYVDNTIMDIYVNRADGTNLHCEYTNTPLRETPAIDINGNQSYNYDTYNIYQTMCYVDLSSYGISNIIIRYKNLQADSSQMPQFFIYPNKFLTFYSISEFNSTEIVNTLNSNTQSLLSHISTENYYINNNLGQIYQKLIENNNQLVTEIKETNKIQQEQNDFLMDDSLPSNTGGDIGDFNDKIATNGTISSLVTMPITFLQKIIGGLNGACSPITIGELFDYNMTMPCINLQQYIGILWNIIDVICAGFLSYHFSKKLVSIFHKVTSMKDGGLEEAYD